MWCGINDLKETNWTTEQIRNITENGLTSKGCTVWNWDYTVMSGMTYQDALVYTTSNSRPSEIPCSQKQNSYFDYDNHDSSIVPEVFIYIFTINLVNDFMNPNLMYKKWDLVCEKAVQRTSAQVLISIGKFVGASTFGILSDK